MEPVGTGHHMTLYLKNILREARYRNFSISLLTTKEATLTEGYSAAVEDIEDNLNIYFMDSIEFKKKMGVLEIMFKNLLWWINLRKSFVEILKNNKPDIIYIPSIDFFSKSLSLLGSPFGRVPFFGLEVSPKIHLKKELNRNIIASNFYFFLFKRMMNISTLLKLFVIDSLFFNFAVKKINKNKDKLTYVPDFGTLDKKFSKGEARKNLGISESDNLILIYGSISKRKGIFELLKSLKNDDIRPNLKIILAGVPDNIFLREYESFLSNNNFLQNLIVERFFYHNLSDESLVFSAADIVWLGYKDFYNSSGVMHQSVFAQRPVLSSKNGLIGNYTKKHKIGITIDTKSKNEIVNSINEIFDQKNYKYFTKNLKNISQINLPKNHMSIIFDCIEKEFSSHISSD